MIQAREEGKHQPPRVASVAASGEDASGNVRVGGQPGHAAPKPGRGTTTPTRPLLPPGTARRLGIRPTGILTIRKPLTEDEYQQLATRWRDEHTHAGPPHVIGTVTGPSHIEGHNIVAGVEPPMSIGAQAIRALNAQIRR